MMPFNLKIKIIKLNLDLSGLISFIRKQVVCVTLLLDYCSSRVYLCIHSRISRNFYMEGFSTDCSYFVQLLSGDIKTTEFIRSNAQ